MAWLELETSLDIIMGQRRPVHFREIFSKVIIQTIITAGSILT